MQHRAARRGERPVRVAAGIDADPFECAGIQRKLTRDPGTIEWIRIDAGGYPDRTLAAARRAMLH